ncbi:hypothetical protein LPW36_02125 [Jinshanibacter sp. LJY008]|uniref:Uncharacterized protein n=1 Tax=Limnobaculum eriocheiris TaxID=2897391 RepID=A0A9X1MW59_9GAMM|nr:hypothetical protein [Limnobaculum eriocheiris]MCD1124842.1 hypothetical protein [Limnobaculum eriocheiris]
MSKNDRKLSNALSSVAKMVEDWESKGESREVIMDAMMFACAVHLDNSKKDSLTLHFTDRTVSLFISKVH